MSFGQDRYRRRYWVLPHAGGIFVEGLESAEPEELTDSQSEQTTDVEMKPNAEKVKTEPEDEQMEEKKEVKEEIKKEEMNGSTDVEMKEEKMEVKSEPVETMDTTTSGDHNGDVKPTKMEDSKQEFKSPTPDGSTASSELPQKLVNGDFAFKEPHGSDVLSHKLRTSGGDKCTGELKAGDHTRIPPVEPPGVKNGRLTPEIAAYTQLKSASSGSVIEQLEGGCKATPHPPPLVPVTAPTPPTSMFMSIDSILSKDSPSKSSSSHATQQPPPQQPSQIFSNNFFLPNMVSSPISAEQMLKNLSSRVASSATCSQLISSSQTSDDWFSILPRMPCDESSLTRSHNQPTDSLKSASGHDSSILNKNETSHTFLSPVPPYASPHSSSFHNTQLSSSSFHMGALSRGSPLDFSVQSMSQCSTPTLYNSMAASSSHFDMSCGYSMYGEDIKLDESMLLDDPQHPAPLPIPARE